MDDSVRDRRDKLLFPVPRVFRDRSCPFDTLSDEEFRLRYRFSRAGFFEIVKILDGEVAGHVQREYTLTTAQRLAITLQTLASNSFQLIMGDVAGVSQSTVSRVVDEVTSWFCNNSRYFIVWPTEEEKNAHKRRIYDKFGMPGIVGAIDGTHVRIVAPSVDEDAHVNRKNYHSLNVNAIVNDKYEFLWLSDSFPGSAHDSRIWRSSGLYDAFVRGDEKGIIVGDSAYRAESFLIKPIGGDRLLPHEIRFNNALCAFRVHVENAFGQLKRQFHCLHGELRYQPLKAHNIIRTCVCLRNLSIALNEAIPDDGGGGDDDDDDTEDESREPDTPAGANKMKSMAIQYYS